MEPITPPKSKKKTVIVVSIIVVVLALIVGGITWYMQHREAPFCFNFVHDTQFGDRKVEHPVNQGFGAPGGMFYYLPEVPALHTALMRQGLYVDPYEVTGGHVYYAAFFGPSTQGAVKAFQKKYKLPETGTVENDTIDVLRTLYGCPTPLSTSTPSQTSTTTLTATSTKK